MTDAPELRADMVMSVKWDKKSKKIGKVLDILGAAVEETVESMVAQRLAKESVENEAVTAEALDRAYRAGYEDGWAEARDAVIDGLAIFLDETS